MAMSLALTRPSGCGELRPSVASFDEWPPIIADVTYVQQVVPATNFCLQTYLNYAIFQPQLNKHMKPIAFN